MSEIFVDTQQLKNRLTQYLDAVKSGQTVIITQRGKPVGRIIPLVDHQVDRLIQLVQMGMIEWNGKTIPPSYQPKIPNKSTHLLSDVIIEERE
ncbi:MAG: type II toxin-antitoxin system prevent-host-death family antitoxin [Anaerolineales bacterium]|nr:type II toxin-antitoxin system prevent-host-death family antitoxin [Anaerolineales bacterium]